MNAHETLDPFEASGDLESTVGSPGHASRTRFRLIGLARRYLGSVILLGVVLGGWQVGVREGHIAAYVLPAPSDIAANLRSDWYLLRPNAFVTAKEIGLGFLIALGSGLVLAIALHASRVLRQAIYPILIASQTIPMIVIAPVLVIILGFGLLPKLIIVAVICFFPIVVNGTDGLASSDPEFERLMKTLHASRLAIFWRVHLPGSLPQMFSGVRIAATYAAIGAVVGEWSGSNNGLGYVMLEATPNLQTARVFSAIIILSAISLILFGLVGLVERLCIPWYHERRR